MGQGTGAEKFSVAPLAGAWIETGNGIANAVHVYLSHPSRVRGLKPLGI